MQRKVDLTGIAPRAIIVMGVSGSGKSTLGALAAAELGCRFLEGDSFHSAEAVAKMHAGHPLSDEDRWPWLDRLGAAMKAAVDADGLVVTACSALRRRYRERLEQAVQAPISFILPSVSEEELFRRVSSRPDHYMPASLLASQLAALEPPAADEDAITLDATRPPEELWAAARAFLAAKVRA